MKKKKENSENISKEVSDSKINLKNKSLIDENLKVKKNNKKSKDKEIDKDNISGENIKVKKDKEIDKDNISGGNIKVKKELNPIMKEMNRFRNEIIGEKIGSKSPKLTIPPFKKCLADARLELKIDEGKKNTIDVVKKAIDLFNNDNSKYL